MKKAIADRWVQALRSGKYKQGHSQLHTKIDDTYCCLGVLCEIEGIKSGDWGLIKSVRNPLRTTAGRINSLDVDLTELNDGSSRCDMVCYNFDEIADIIQINWKEL